MMEDDMFRLFRLSKIFICEGNQQLKRSGANGFQTGKDMSSFLLDKPSVGETIDSRQLSTGVTVTGVQHSKDSNGLTGMSVDIAVVGPAQI